MGKYLVSIALLFSACNFLEVQVVTHQRSITDVGDATSDGYSYGETNKRIDRTETVVKTIP